ALIGLTLAGLQIVNQWPNGYEATLSIPIGNTINGWEIMLKFAGPVSLQAWLGDVQSNVGDQTYVLRNKDYNGNLASGSTYEFKFVVDFKGVSGNLIQATINGQNIDLGENIPVNPGTTAATTPAGSTQGPINPTLPNGNYDYGAVLRASLLFYEAQRAGKLPANNRIPWRSDSMLMDRGENGEDLTGGYFDAGDYVKFNFPMAGTTTLLAWGVLDYEDAYATAGELVNAREALKWATDYFIKCHVSKREFYGQVGDGNDDHASWSRPEDWTKNRPAWKLTNDKPGSDLLAETAAALAATAMVFRTADKAYSDTLIHHARELYDFANDRRGKYSDSIPNASSFYNSWSGYGDELAWGAAWLYRATSDPRYRFEVDSHWNEFSLGGQPQEFGWDDKKAGVQILMARVTGEQKFKQAAESFCNYIVRNAPKSPKGLVFLSQWGALRHAGNVAFVCLQAAAAGINTQEYVNFAAKQINYILGDSGRSYVIGFGNDYPKKPHHRSSSCPNRPALCDWNAYNSPNPNPQLLVGALVGGPDQQDFYEDKRDDYIKNEVATDYNAGFTSAVAGLAHYANKV
ncbi:unnamed protein product, partial [Didymodactylos carnosus]